MIISTIRKPSIRLIIAMCAGVLWHLGHTAIAIGYVVYVLLNMPALLEYGAEDDVK